MRPLAPPIRHSQGGSADYAERAARHVPALHELHALAGLLLAEHVPEAGRVLVLGAGGGLDLRAFADRHPGWRLDGVDPSPDMLAQARVTLGPLSDRAALHLGYADDAPDGPFDGAACLLTLHFLPRPDRLHALRQLARRLRPGAPLVVAHHSFPVANGQQDLWLRRNARLLASRGVPAAQAEAGIAGMKERLPVLAPDEDEAVLREAGFGGIQLFFAAFTFRGWVGYLA